MNNFKYQYKTKHNKKRYHKNIFNTHIKYKLMGRIYNNYKEDLY